MKFVVCYRMHLLAERERFPVVVELRRLGHQAAEIADGPWDPGDGNVLLVLGNLNWFPRLRRQLLTTGKPPETLVAIWHTEPLPPPAGSGFGWPRPALREIVKIVLHDPRATDVYTNYFLLHRLWRKGLPDVLTASTRSRAAFLADRGIPAEYVPIGYEPGCGRQIGTERDIDVLFLGECRIGRRRRMIAKLRSLGLKVMSCGDWSDPARWGEGRTALLNRVKVLLNIPRFTGEFAALRFILGMANGALVVSEPVYDSFPFVAGRHFASASIEEIPALALHYLQNEKQRRQIADQAYKFVTEELTMERSVARLLDLIVTKG